MTKMLFSFIAVALGLATLSPLAAQTPSVTQAVETTTAFFEALKKGDVASAQAMVATFPGISDEAMRQQQARTAKAFVEGTAKRYAEKQADFVVIPGEWKMEDGCAVVALHNKVATTGEYEKAFLVLEAGVWKVLPAYRNHSKSSDVLTEAQQSIFRKFENWWRDTWLIKSN